MIKINKDKTKEKIESLEKAKERLPFYCDRLSPCKNILCLRHNKGYYLRFSRAINNLINKGDHAFLTVIHLLSWSAKDYVVEILKKLIRHSKYATTFEKINLRFLLAAEPHNITTAIHLNLYSFVDKHYNKTIPENELQELLNELGREIKTELKNIGQAYGKIDKETAITINADAGCASTGFNYIFKDVTKGIEATKRLLACNNGRAFLYQSAHLFVSGREKQAASFKKKRNNFSCDINETFDEAVKVNTAKEPKHWANKGLYLQLRDEGLDTLQEKLQPVLDLIKSNKDLKTTQFYKNIVDVLNAPNEIDLDNHANDFKLCARLYLSITNILKTTNQEQHQEQIRKIDNHKELKRIYNNLLKYGTIEPEPLVLIKRHLDTSLKSLFSQNNNLQTKTSKLLPLFLLNFYVFTPLRL